MAVQRTRTLKDGPIRDGQYVLYWMQAAHRARCNPALEFAIERANETTRPVVVLFCLVSGSERSGLG